MGGEWWYKNLKFVVNASNRCRGGLRAGGPAVTVQLQVTLLNRPPEGRADLLSIDGAHTTGTLAPLVNDYDPSQASPHTPHPDNLLATGYPCTFCWGVYF